MERPEIKIVRSRRKTISVEVAPDCTVTVRAPKYVSMKDIDRFIEDHGEWIDRHLEKMRRRIDALPVQGKFSERELEKLKETARTDIPPMVGRIAERMGVPYNRVTIRAQKTVWGSCSAKRNLNFNCLLVLLPEPVIEYVIVHELCHLIYLDHSPAFWREVEKHCPDYRYLRGFLKDTGEQLMLRM